MRSVSDRICRENQNVHFTSHNFIFFENRVVYEIIWKNIVKPGRPHRTIWCTLIACWALNSTNTNSEYVTFIAFPRQQRWNERVCVFHYTYIGCIVINVQDYLKSHYTHTTCLCNINSCNPIHLQNHLK